MTLKVNKSDILISPDSEFADSWEGDLSQFAKAALTTLYPVNIVNRCLYRPWLGKWYPYLDVSSPDMDNQLTFCFGEVELYLSRQKFCAWCGNQTDREIKIEKDSLSEGNVALKRKCEKDTGGSGSKTSSYVPISYCAECRSKIYYEYWKCLESVYNCVVSNTFQKLVQDNRSISNFKTCGNLLSPRCRFPLDSEKTNPCLKNHGIGVLLTDKNSLRILIGPLEKLKYNMIWEGGVFGAVFGYSNKIMSLDILGLRLTNFFRCLFDEFKNQDLIREFPQNNLLKKLINTSSEENISKPPLTYIHHFNAANREEMTDLNESFATLLLLNYLNYYQNHSIRRFLNNSLGEITPIFRKILTAVLKGTNLELIQYVELFNMYPPLHSLLRNFIDKSIMDRFNVNSIPDGFQSISKDDTKQLLECVKSSFSILDWRANYNKSGRIEISKILGALGSRWIVEESYHPLQDGNAPRILKIEDVIGSRIGYRPNILFESNHGKTVQSCVGKQSIAKST
ncbi:MAG: hypothetical protein GF383_15735 [Candidatus Lokiarchaeota archaeon]|nr:hypothetical protein [Candidatus Lokiarchaeota archaeon]MBD3343078.1 hypothetical protein [Candidatus Lokiarchaeota archaeon]